MSAVDDWAGRLRTWTPGSLEVKGTQKDDEGMETGQQGWRGSELDRSIQTEDYSEEGRGKRAKSDGQMAQKTR